MIHHVAQMWMERMLYGLIAGMLLAVIAGGIRAYIEAHHGSLRDIRVRVPVSLHHDVSTVTGEEVILFTLAAPPGAREARKR